MREGKTDQNSFKLIQLYRKDKEIKNFFTGQKAENQKEEEKINFEPNQAQSAPKRIVKSAEKPTQEPIHNKSFLT